jgi:aspartate oxidase
VYRDMLQTGLGMADPEFCRILVTEVGDAIKRLQEMGLKFKSRVFATMAGEPECWRHEQYRRHSEGGY